MPLTNAERQQRHREKLKKAAVCGGCGRYCFKCAATIESAATHECPKPRARPKRKTCPGCCQARTELKRRSRANEKAPA